MAQIERGGVASIYIGGATYEVSAEITIKLGGVVRTGVASSNGTAGFTTKWELPEVEFEALDAATVSVTGLKGLVNTPFQVLLNNGKSYLIAGATQVDDPSVKIHEGKISGLKFTGDFCQEVGTSA
jgi:hypothetical protein